jgi:1,4-dihydroxy-6-naphthoate synthase
MAAKKSDEGKRRKAAGAAGKKPAVSKAAKKPAPAAKPKKSVAAMPAAGRQAGAKPAKRAPRTAASRGDPVAKDIREEARREEAARVARVPRAAPPRETDEDHEEPERVEGNGSDDEALAGGIRALVAELAETVERPPRPRKVAPVPPMPPRRTDGTITLAYSSDSDDAFMFYALEYGKVDTQGRRYESVRKDIETLNQEAKAGTYDVTAISFGAYPQLFERYAVMTCGCSFGDAQGPIVVARTPVRAEEVNGLQVAVPGHQTTAATLLKLWLHPWSVNMVALPFDKISLAVRAGKVRSGLLIHEGQVTWQEEGLVKVVDLGEWWAEKTEGLPLPLGATGVRRDISKAERALIHLDVKRSIAYGLGHRDEALEYAVKFARGLDKKKVDKYIRLYVNELTLDFAERGRQAAQHLLDEMHRHRLTPSPVDIEIA